MQVYYINVAARTDRRAFMEGQLERLGLAAERIDAVTPAQVPDADRAAYSHPSRPYWLSIPELACSLSHLRVMERHLADGAPMSLVLEDDAVLSRRLPAFLAALEKSPREFDLLRIETSDARVRVRPEGPTVAGIEIVRLVGYDAGSCGYVLSRRGAQRILANVEARKRPVDQAFFDSYAPLARSIVVRQAVPGLCVQSRMPVGGVAELVSDLGNGDARPAAEAPYAWRHRLHRWRRAIYRDTVIALHKQWFVHAAGAKLIHIPFLAD
jgi:glycosyl transferase family 25